MAATHLIHQHSVHLARCLTIVAIALALVLSAFVVDAVAGTGLLTRTVAVERETFHVVTKYSPLKFVPPSPRAHPAE
jgi:hypothetical protein